MNRFPAPSAFQLKPCLGKFLPLRRTGAAVFALLLLALGLFSATPVYAQAPTFRHWGGWLNGPAGSQNFTIGGIGTAPDTNNWPSNENPNFLHVNFGAGKFLIFKGSNAGFVWSNTSPAIAYNRLSLTTANDAAGRDPASYIIYGSTASLLDETSQGTNVPVSSLTEIASGTLALTNDRNDSSLTPAAVASPAIVQFSNTTAYPSYVVVFPTTKDGLTSTATQISKATFSKGTLTVPNQVLMGKVRAGVYSGFLDSGVIGTSNPGLNWPAGEHPGLAFDGLLNTKFLIFQARDSFLLASPEAGTAVVNSLSFWTAGDAPERDPASYKIYGLEETFEDTSFTERDPGTLIAEGPLNLPTARNDGPTTVNFTNTTAYASYVVVFPTVRNLDENGQPTPGNTITQIAEIAFGGSPPVLAPTVTSPTSASITHNSAMLGGNVTSDGGSAILERGIVYSRTSANSNPLIAGSGVTKVTASGTTGVFTAPASALTASTGYSFKAYATNAVGTSYSSVATFTTLAPPAPTIASVSPNSGSTKGGTLVTTTGTNFTEATSVAFHETEATSFNVVNATTITATTPAHAAGLVNIIVTRPGGSVSGEGLFTYIEMPEITVDVIYRDDDDNVPNGGNHGFSNVAVGASQTNKFEIFNAGTAPLNLTGTPKLALTGSSDFSIETQPAASAIAPFGRVEFRVIFAPTSLGAKTATLTIANNDSDENPYTINLSGTGIPAPETVKIGGSTVVSVPDFGSNTTVTNPLTGETVITGTVDGDSPTDKLSFTLPAGKAVTHASLRFLSYAAAVPRTDDGFEGRFPQQLTYESRSQNDFFAGETDADTDVVVITRCAWPNFSFTLNAPEVESFRIVNLGPGDFFEEIVKTYGSARYELTFQIGDAATTKELSNLTSTNSSLSPAFESGVTSYSVTVPTTQTFVDLTPTWISPTIYASMQVNGGTPTRSTSGQSDVASGLVEGANTVLFRVCAQDGSETIYTVNITRGESNLAPTFSGYAFSTAKGTQARVATAKILARAADADGGTLTISSVGAATAQGGGASVSGGLLTYTPLLNFTGMDSIAVTISDGQGGSVSGSIIVTVTDGSAASQNQAFVKVLGSGNVGVLFYGIPDQTYEIQRSTDLEVWTEVFTTTAQPDGSIPWEDTNPPQGGTAFYRTAVGEK